VLPGFGVVLCLSFGIIWIVHLLWENGELGPKRGRNSRRALAEANK